MFKGAIKGWREQWADMTPGWECPRLNNREIAPISSLSGVWGRKSNSSGFPVWERVGWSNWADALFCLWWQTNSLSWHYRDHLIAARFDPKTLDMRLWTKAAFLSVMHHLLRDENTSVNGFVYLLDATGLELKHKLFWGLNDIKRHIHIVQVNINTLRPEHFCRSYI